MVEYYYLYIFEDGLIQQSSQMPTNAEFGAIDAGVLEVLRFNSELKSTPYEQLLSNGYWEKIEELDEKNLGHEDDDECNEDESECENEAD